MIHADAVMCEVEPFNKSYAEKIGPEAVSLLEKAMAVK